MRSLKSHFQVIFKGKNISKCILYEKSTCENKIIPILKHVYTIYPQKKLEGIRIMLPSQNESGSSPYVFLEEFVNSSNMWENSPKKPSGTTFFYRGIFLLRFNHFTYYKIIYIFLFLLQLVLSLCFQEFVHFVQVIYWYLLIVFSCNPDFCNTGSNITLSFLILVI